MIRTTLVAALLAIGGAAPLAAQTPAPPAPKQTITFNPIGLAAGFFSAEYERAVAPNYTVSGGASYFTLDVGDGDVSYSSADVRARFYPNQALEGFSVGLSGGVIRTAAKYDDGYESDHASNNGVTVGSSLEYAWLLGHQERTAFSLGLGFKRVLLFGGNTPDASTFYPTFRTSFGFAF
jgi:hypothetical protein